MVKKIFIQDWGTYLDKTLVVVNSEFKDVVSFCKSNKIYHRDMKKMLKILKEEMASDCKGSLIESDEKRTLLYIRKFDYSWESYSIILHEIHHEVYLWAKKNCMENEMEAQAYQFEYLFNEINKKLI